jgi:hypothetical protein
MDNERFYDVGYVGHYAADGSFTQLSLSDLTGCGNFYCFLETPTLCPDGAGGVFVAWSQACGVRVLRLTPDLHPAPGWPSTGVVAEDCPMASNYVGICTDGSGGAYVAWQGYPNGEHHLNLQHVTGSGAIAPGWPPGKGLVLSTHPTLPGLLRPYGWAFCSIVPDQLGGALVAWTDARADTGDVYVQRVRSDGTIPPAWASEGVGIGIAPGMQENPVLAADGLGGAWVAWQSDPDSTIRANRVDATGAVVAQSSPAGVLVSGGPGARFVPRVASDGAQGAFIAWIDDRNGSGDIYASHLSGDMSVVSVTPTPVFGIEGIRPNPSRGTISCRVTLGNSGAASLELLDVAGRTWVHRSVESLGPGTHEVTLRAPTAMGSGVFFVRLRSSGGAHVSRITILR